MIRIADALRYNPGALLLLIWRKGGFKPAPTGKSADDRQVVGGRDGDGMVLKTGGSTQSNSGSTLPPTWPADLEVRPLGEKTIVRVHFADAPSWHPPLISYLLALADDPAYGRTYPGCRGIKIDGIDRLDTPALRLINGRARALFRHVLGTPEAVIDGAWANIYRSGDYCMPHSHVRAMASVVYSLDPGEPDPNDPVAGRLFFADPRLAACCRPAANYLTTPIMPDMRAGTMVIFPAHIVHAVNPYTGTRPRITLAWNLNPEALPTAGA